MTNVILSILTFEYSALQLPMGPVALSSECCNREAIMRSATVTSRRGAGGAAAARPFIRPGGPGLGGRPPEARGSEEHSIASGAARMDVRAPRQYPGQCQQCQHSIPKLEKYCPRYSKR
ncbi:hypothetical protein ACJJTC_003671 [Scirpophaga incertulas]